MEEREQPREFERRPVNHQATVFLILTILVAGAAFWFFKSFVGVAPDYEAGPAPSLQERWQLELPVDTESVETAASGTVDGEGTTVWDLTYATGTPEELERVASGPRRGAPVNGPLEDCSTLDIYLSDVDTTVTCEELRGAQSRYAVAEQNSLWVVWLDQRIVVIQHRG